MVNKLLKAGAISCVFILLLTGCASRKELKTLGIVNSTLYDLTGDGGINLTAEVLKPSQGGSKGSGGQDSPTVLINSQGKTIPESIRNATNSFDRQLYAPHNKVRFFTEKMAQNGLTPTMDYFLRSQEIRQTAYLFVVKGDNPQQIYSSALGIESNVGDFIESMSVTEAGSTSATVFVDLIGFMKSYYLNGKQPVLGVVEMVPNDDGGDKAGSQSGGGEKSSGGGESDKKKMKLKCSGIAAFKNDKLVGYLDEEEAKCYNILENSGGKNSINIPFKNESAVMERINSKSKMNVELVDGHVNANIKVTLNLALAHVGAAVTVDPTTIQQMEQILNQQVADQIIAVVKKAQQEFKSDIFGFGETLHAQHPDEWRSIKQNWNDDYFPSATVKVEVTSAINRAGTTENAFAYESE